MDLFPVTDIDREIYETEIKDFLPEKIIDIHTHVWLDKDHTKKELPPGEMKRT
ncbi:MAG: hypothetical protein GX352_07865, partial [Clostridiales bacterium]|nr:hypothetical protein [Clostridiales bacterium]